MKGKERHLAAHKILTPDGAVEMGVVDLQDGKVNGWHALKGEEPNTEWLWGTIEIRGIGREPIIYKGIKEQQ